jgi:hypothetical protein
MATASKASNTKASSKAVDYTKIKQFLSNGSNDIALLPLEAQILQGWRWSAVLSYNSGVKKFMRFMKVSSKEF